MPRPPSKYASLEENTRMQSGEAVSPLASTDSTTLINPIDVDILQPQVKRRSCRMTRSMRLESGRKSSSAVDFCCLEIAALQCTLGPLQELSSLINSTRLRKNHPHWNHHRQLLVSLAQLNFKQDRCYSLLPQTLRSSVWIPTSSTFRGCTIQRV